MAPRENIVTAEPNDSGGSVGIDTSLPKGTQNIGEQPLFTIYDMQNFAATCLLRDFTSGYGIAGTHERTSQAADPQNQMVTEQGAYQMKGSKISSQSQQSHLLNDPSFGFQLLRDPAEYPTRVRTQTKKATVSPGRGTVKVGEKRNKGAPGRRIMVQRLPSARANARSSLTAGSDCGNFSTSRSMGSLQIKDSNNVRVYMKARFLALQQQVCKKIAKVWIRAICPKKQSKYPYKNLSKTPIEDTKSRGSHSLFCIPPWWPSTDTCKYKEPDHVHRTARVNLLVHLLRLRPTAAQLLDWNDGLVEPSTAVAHKGWTAFLRDATHQFVFGEHIQEPQEKVDRRPVILEELFTIAGLEEDYFFGGCDGNTTVAWDPLADQQTIAQKAGPPKRSPSPIDDTEKDNGSTTRGDNPTRARKRRRGSDETIKSEESDSGVTLTQVCRAGSNSTVSDISSNWESQTSLGSGLAGSSHSSPLSSSVGSTQSERTMLSDLYEGPSDFPGNTDWSFPQARSIQPWQPITAFSTTDIPLPYFNGTPTNIGFLPELDFVPDASYAGDGQAYGYESAYAPQYPASGYPGIADHATITDDAVGIQAGMHHQLGMHRSTSQATQYREQASQLYEFEPLFQYPDHKPLMWVTPDSSPGPVHRGFTGYGSGTGGGAPT